MGGVVTSLFGGGMEMPEAPDYSAPPDRESNGEPEAQATRDEQLRRNRARAGGVRSTLLSNPHQASGLLGSSAGTSQ